MKSGLGDWTHCGAQLLRLIRIVPRLICAPRLPGTDALQGFEIGLATVLRIIQRGGSLWGEAASGTGTTFYVTLQPEPAGTHTHHSMKENS